MSSVAAWSALAALILILLIVDFLLFGRGPHAPSMRRATAWSIGWIALALLFGAAFWAVEGHRAGAEYFAGYLLERSLSLDNIFVFAVILSYFAVPPATQGKVLSWGIALALVLRLVFILAGAALLDAFHATFYLFGLILLYTAWKLARHEDEQVDPEHNPALRLVRARIPMTADYDGDRLVVRRGGRRAATPLTAVFVVVATTDIVFAVDSIPAIFAVTQEPLVVFAANAFAMLGLRPLYFVLVGMMDRFAYLSYGLAIILGVIGAKMLLVDLWHPPIWLSLALIIGVLGVTVAVSLRATRRADLTPSAGSDAPDVPLSHSAARG